MIPPSPKKLYMAYRPIVNFELLYGKNLVTSPT